MGIYLNPGSDIFQRALRSAIYVDKTEMIHVLNRLLNTEHSYVCISRPRRFGKSMALHMLAAYYGRGEDTKTLFSPYKIASCDSFDRYRNQFDVLQINMADFATRTNGIVEMLSLLEHRLMHDIKKAYGDPDETFVLNVTDAMNEVYAEQNRYFVILIDEWDCIFRMFPEDSAGQKHYLDFLRDWLKDKPYIALAYMTGILPIKKYGEHSALNMFYEYSMTGARMLSPYVGFTEDEVRALCQKYNRDFEGVRDWYDGYRLSYEEDIFENDVVTQTISHEIHIYSPRSVVDCMLTGSLENYWNATETYEALKKQISRNFDDLKTKVALLMEGQEIPVNIRKYQNDMTSFASADDVLTMLVHIGYLGYNRKTRCVFIPNKEILDEYHQSVSDNAEWDRLFAMLDDSHKLLEATWKKDADTVARMVENAHRKADNRTYNSEAALSYAIRLAYYSAEQYYTLIPEMQAGKGYADLTYLPTPEYPEKPALLVELKWNRDADSAMEQVRRQEYPAALAAYQGNIILVGIGYDKSIANEEKSFKHHSCVIA